MITFDAMNTNFLISGLPPAKQEEVKKLIKNAHTTFSRFDPDSEISYINKSRGLWVAVSPLTFQILQAAVSAYQETEGLFNPFLGDIIKNLGYNKTFEKLSYPPDFGIYNLPPVDYDTLPPVRTLLTKFLELDDERSLVCLSPDVTLDLGGIAKGWIAQYACDQLQLSGITSGLIDAGGDIILWGKHPEHSLWGVGVSQPWKDGPDIADLWCEGTTAIATSSIVKRRWLSASNSSLHHIIDPRIQSPACSDLVQVTILARDLVIAEQYAKCMLILGSEQGMTWMKEKRDPIGFIAVRHDGCILTSNNLHQYCSELEVLPYANTN